METELEQLEQSVRDSESLKQLMDTNEAFKKLFIKAQEDKLMEIGYNFYHLDDARKDKANEEQKAIGYFFDRIYGIINEGEGAKQVIEEIIAEREEGVIDA